MASKLIVNEIEHTDGSGTAVTMAKATIADATLTSATLTAGTIASGVTGPWGNGVILQVKSTTKVDMFTTTSGPGFTDITGLEVAITPASTSNKVLVMASFQFGTSHAAGYPNFRMTRNLPSDPTVINGGTAVGNRISGILTANIHNADTGSGLMMNTHFLDSPSTTSATTYKIQAMQSTGWYLYVGQGGNNPDSSWSTRSASTITVMEIQA